MLCGAAGLDIFKRINTCVSGAGVCRCVARVTGWLWCEVSRECISGFEKSAPFPPPLRTGHNHPVDKKRHHDVLVQKTKVQ